MTIMGKVIKWQTHRQEPVPSVQALQLVPGKPGSWSIGPVWENFMDVGRSLQSVVMHQKRHSIKTTRTGQQYETLNGARSVSETEKSARLKGYCIQSLIGLTETWLSAWSSAIVFRNRTGT